MLVAACFIRSPNRYPLVPFCSVCLYVPSAMRHALSAPQPPGAMCLSTLPHNITRHKATPHSTTQHNTTPHHTAQHSTAQHNAWLHFVQQLWSPCWPCQGSARRGIVTLRPSPASTQVSRGACGTAMLTRPVSLAMAVAPRKARVLPRRSLCLGREPRICTGTGTASGMKWRFSRSRIGMRKDSMCI